MNYTPTPEHIASQEAAGHRPAPSVGIPHMTLPGYCDTCHHKERDHGDRAIGGHCDHGQYPNTACNCTGYTEGGATSGTPLGAA